MSRRPIKIVFDGKVLSCLTSSLLVVDFVVEANISHIIWCICRRKPYSMELLRGCSM